MANWQHFSFSWCYAIIFWHADQNIHTIQAFKTKLIVRQLKIFLYGLLHYLKFNDF